MLVWGDLRPDRACGDTCFGAGTNGHNAFYYYACRNRQTEAYRMPSSNSHGS